MVDSQNNNKNDLELLFSLLGEIDRIMFTTECKNVDSKKFVVRFRFYWRPPEEFYFHWRGFKKCILQFKTLRRVVYIPLE